MTDEKRIKRRKFNTYPVRRRITMIMLTSNETPIVGKLSIISMKGCEGITAKIDEYLRAFRGYEDTETYVTHVTCPEIWYRQRNVYAR